MSHSAQVQNCLWAVIEQCCLWSHCSDITHDDYTVDDSNNNDVVIIIVVIIVVVREGEESNKEESENREDKEEDSFSDSVKEAEREENMSYISSDSCCNSVDNESINEL